MKHRKTTTLLTSLLLIPMTQAQADNGSTERTVEANYRADYAFVRNRTDRPAGCDLLRHQCRDRNPSLAVIARSDRLLTQEIRVSQAEQTAAVTGAAGQPPGTDASSSGGGLPSCTWSRESGGDYSAVNPSSGAYGKYQIMPQTASDFGCNLATPAGQDACAQVIWQKQGPSAWVHC